jgi:hypothetical protein
MDWQLRRDEGTAADPHGLRALLGRLEAELATGGARLSGFTFLQDSRRMLAFSRQIERALLDAGAPGPLYVGFQNADKLHGETARYRRLRARGVRTLAFGEGAPTVRGAESVEAWTALAPDHARLENQWFLVSQTPAPIAFVGWEVSDDALWGRFGVTAEGKRFTGFVSEDERVVQAVIAHLDRVRDGQTPSAAGRPRSIGAHLLALQPRTILTVVDNGRRSFLRRSLPAIVDGAAEARASLLLYDITAASYLVDPYPHGERDWRRPLDPPTLRSLGRGYVADMVEEASRHGVTARAILPDGVGFGHLATWCESAGVDVVVVPIEYARPSLVDRLQGYTLKALRGATRIAILVDDPTGEPWLLPAMTSSQQTISGAA